MKISIPLFATALVFSVSMAHSDIVSFYVDDTMSTYSETVIVTDNPDFAGPGEANLTRRYADLNNYSVPQFNASLGTLNSVDIYFGVGAPSVAQNNVSVALDDDCGPDCDKQLSVDVSYGFGLSTSSATGEGGGPINQFFDVSVQALLDFGNFDNNPSALFPSSGDVAFIPGSLDGDYSVLSLSDAGSLSAFTGSGDIVFDVGPAINLALSLSCRDGSGSGILCNEAVDIDAGGTDWAAQFVYDYTRFEPGLGATPPEPGRIYTGIDGLQIFPAGGGGGERDLTFFSDGSPFTPAVIPLPAPMLLLISAFGILGVLRRRSLNKPRA